MQNKGNIFKFGFISLLILLSLNFKPSNSYIVLPLEYLPKSNYKFLPKEDYSDKPEIIMKELYYKRLITYLNIGTPLKSQMMFIDTDTSRFFLTSLNPPFKSHEEPKISEFYEFGENLFFNESESSSYKEEQCKEHDQEYKEVCFAKDQIKFNFGNYSSSFDFPIKVFKGEDERIPGMIGLAINSSIIYGTKDLISELKLYNFIKDYYYFFDIEKVSPLNSEIKGNLIIGDLPHNIFPDKYPKEEFINLKYHSDSPFWSYEMKKIQAESKTKNDIQITNTKIHTFYEFYHVIGTTEFWNELRELFLNKLEKENKCFLGKFSQNMYSFDDLNFYYCDISVEKILLDNLSGIKFYPKNSDFVFELTKDELYYKKGKYIYFNILFFKHQYNDWILGQIFSLKYHFVFNTDTRQIGFYKKVNFTNDDNPTNNELNGGKSNKKIWTFIIITAFIFIIIGIIIGIVIGIKFLAKRRKKKAKELVDEDYDYIPKNEENVVN